MIEATQVAIGAMKPAMDSSAAAPRIENLAIAAPRSGFGALPLWARLQVSIALVLIVVWSLMIYLTYTARRDDSILQAQNFVENVNQMTMSGTTATMLSGVVKDRGVFLDQIENSNDVNDIRALRFGSVLAQYGAGTADSTPTTEEKVVLEKGNPRLTAAPGVNDIVRGLVGFPIPRELSGGI